jgi:hypothetical protein
VDHRGIAKPLADILQRERRHLYFTPVEAMPCVM